MSPPPARERWDAGRRAALAFAALGAGLVHLVVAIAAPVAPAVALGVVAVAELLWGALAVSRPGFPVPRVALVGALVPPAAWAVLLATGAGAGTVPVLPMVGATLLDLAVGAGIAWGLRRTPARSALPASARIAIAAGVVAAIALASIVAAGIPLPEPAPAPPHVGH